MGVPFDKLRTGIGGKKTSDDVTTDEVTDNGFDIE